MDIQTIREVIRLRQLNHSMNAIAKRLTLSSSTVKRVIDRAKLLGLTWDEMKAINDDDLGALFRTPHAPNQSTSSEFDWVLIYQQSRGIKAKTLKELWTLHCSEQSLSYSAFCKRFKLFKKYLPVELTELSLTQNWDPGEVAMIDYAGTKAFVKDPKNGQLREVNVFVGILAYSGFTFCVATDRQTRQDWLDAIIEMFQFFGGIPQYVYLDNSTSLVLQADKYHPRICDELRSLCEYHGCTAYAVAPGQPKHKALVEGAVRLITDRVIKPLRQRTFFSLETLNVEMKKLLLEHNKRLLSNSNNETRLSLYEEELPYLTQLPAIQFERTMIVKTLKVQKNYLIRYHNRRYSVPYRYVGQSLKVIIYPYRKQLQCFDIKTGEKVVEHTLRDDGPKTVVALDHMPSNHRFVLMGSEELLQWVGKGGEKTTELAKRLINGRTKRDAVRLLRGIHAMQQKHGLKTIEECCSATLEKMDPSYVTLENIVQQRSQESVKTIKIHSTTLLKQHATNSNIRGAGYYKSKSGDRS